MNFLTIYPNYAKPINHFKNVFSKLYKDNIYFLGCGGKGLNSFIKGNKDKIIISFFPGITTNIYQLEAFVSRLRSDLVLLNSKKDEFLYRQICKIFHLPYNGFLYGASWFIKEKRDIRYKNSIIFFEQIYVPLYLKDRISLLHNLIKLSKRYPNSDFYIKSRDKNLHNSLFNISKSFILPRNLKFTHDDTSLLINSAKIILSISSSVIIEAILSHKQSACIDFGYTNSCFHTFEKSNLIVNFNQFDLENMPTLDLKWSDENVLNPYDNINSLKNVLLDIKKEERKIHENYLLYFQLFINYPSYFFNNIASCKKIRQALKMIQLD